jgi:potassium-transporting ATPase KdpC subunit
MKKQAVIAFKILLIMTVLTGIIYPVLMTGVAQLLFPSKSNGSLIVRDGKIIGSKLIGQKFDSSIYFWSRPSATDYNAVPSGATNYGPTSDTLKKLSRARGLLFAQMNSVTDVNAVPEEMIFASGSGLDPEISPEAALLQVDRIVKARHFDNNQKQKLLETIKKMSEKPQYLLFGEKRINVLLLNLMLDKLEVNINNNN